MRSSISAACGGTFVSERQRSARLRSTLRCRFGRLWCEFHFWPCRYRQFVFCNAPADSQDVDLHHDLRGGCPFCLFDWLDYSWESVTNRSNQAMERTATRCAFTVRVATASSPRSTHALGGRR